MKKLYIQPRTDVCDIQVSNHILEGSPGVIGGGSANIGWGGNDSDPDAGADVKGNSFEFEW